MNRKVVSQEQEAGQSSKPVLIIGECGDRNTILAALRVYQHAGMGEPINRPDDIHDIATNNGRDISMDDDGIDDLCERVNSAPSERRLVEVSTAELFAELRRRGANTGLHGAIGALYDQLEQQNLIPGGSQLLTYLAYRLKREEALVSGLPDAKGAAHVWQLKIDKMEKAKT